MKKRHIKIIITIAATLIIFLSFVFSKGKGIYILHMITPLIISFILWRTERKIKTFKRTLAYIKNIRYMLYKASIGIWLGSLMKFISLPYVLWIFLLYGSLYYAMALAKMMFFLIIAKRDKNDNAA